MFVTVAAIKITNALLFEEAVHIYIGNFGQTELFTDSSVQNPPVLV
jgi:hypothetical protein